MNWKVCLMFFCVFIFALSLVSGQDTRRTQRNRTQNRRNRQRGNRGNTNRRRGRVTQRGRLTNNQGTVLSAGDSTECELIQVPMCRGMVGYTHTRLPNQFGHTNQQEVYRALEYMWAFMDIGCSKDFRVTACGYYLPKCTPGQRGVQLPCKETCNSARRCKKRMRQLQSRWPNEFRCKTLSARSERNCIIPAPNQPSCQQRHVTCERNSIPMCQNLTFTHGSLPNMFLQCNVDEIQTEMAQYEDLLASNCSPFLRFFICGIYMPYCVRADTPFALPCREICEDVRRGCQQVFTRLHGNLPWPNKFQCHRYPLATNTQQVCASPSDVTLRLPDIVTERENEGNQGNQRNQRNQRNRQRTNRNSRNQRN